MKIGQNLENLGLKSRANLVDLERDEAKSDKAVYKRCGAC